MALRFTTTTPTTIIAMPISYSAAADSPSARILMTVIAAVPIPDHTA